MIYVLDQLAYINVGFKSVLNTWICLRDNVILVKLSDLGFGISDLKNAKPA